MKREHLEAVYEELVADIDSTNDAAADDDRGRANDTLCLTFFDDGSGRIGYRKEWNRNEVEDIYDFDNFEEFVARLKDIGVEIGDPPAKCEQCGSTKCRCDRCGREWCLDHQTNPLTCPGCGARGQHVRGCDSGVPISTETIGL